MKVTVHADGRIAWQSRRAQFFVEGFRRIGVDVEVTSDRFRHDGLPVLLGTTLWRDIERDGGEFLLVDRCSFGDTDKFVTLVRNGHGRRGDHRTPEVVDGTRWERHGVDLVPWRTSYDRVVLCGQVETYSPHFATPDEWYATVKATHFRPHPASMNFTGLPTSFDFDNALAVTLNSSVAVQAVLQGVPTITMDEGSMAWAVTGHAQVFDPREPDRLPWCHWLAWTQWSDDEIREGTPWAYLL